MGTRIIQRLHYPFLLSCFLYVTCASDEAIEPNSVNNEWVTWQEEPEYSSVDKKNFEFLGKRRSIDPEPVDIGRFAGVLEKSDRSQAPWWRPLPSEKRNFEFLGKRDPSKRTFEFLGKRNFEFLGKRNFEFPGKRGQPQLYKRTFEFLGKRSSPPSPETWRQFVEARLQRMALPLRPDKRNFEFLGKRNFEFLGKRDEQRDNYLRELLRLLHNQNSYSSL